MNSGVALCFPGQGSQGAGMGEGLDDFPEAARLLAAAADLGLDLWQALSGDDDALRPTEIAQPALFYVETLLGLALSRQLKIRGVAGHSVGEYAALVVSGALDAADGMALVVKRGRLMQQMQAGAMAAVLGLDVESATEMCAQCSAPDEPVVVANINAPGQVVISGAVPAVERAGAAARERGAKRVVRLNVSGAFHSPLMEKAATDFAAELEAVTFAEPRFPVVCNVDGQATGDGAGLRRRLIAQLRSPVQWIACVQTLRDLGCEEFVEVGPGNVLGGLARRIDSELQIHHVGSRAEMLTLLSEMKVKA